jgi:hypothetical protein
VIAAWLESHTMLRYNACTTSFFLKNKQTQHSSDDHYLIGVFEWEDGMLVEKDSIHGHCLLPDRMDARCRDLSAGRIRRCGLRGSSRGRKAGGEGRVIWSGGECQSCE